MDNDTPLHDAVVNGHLRLIKLLVEKGADIHAKNAKGKSPLELASSTVQPYLLNTSLPLPGKCQVGYFSSMLQREMSFLLCNLQFN